MVGTDVVKCPQEVALSFCFKPMELTMDVLDPQHSSHLYQLTKGPVTLS